MNQKPKIIIPDTNALIAIAEYKIDLFENLNRICDFPYQIQVLQATLEELEKIKQASLKKSRLVQFINLLLKQKKIEIIPQEGYVDDLLVEHSYLNNHILTQDNALKKRLKKPYFTIRQQKYIILVK